MDMEKLKIRDSSLDLIRLTALAGVLSVHFFIGAGFYNVDITGKRMYLMVMMRSFFMYCVPMFLMLSGYLMNQKECSRHFYKGIIKTLVVYLLASAANTLFLISRGQDITFKEFILKLLDYTAAPYAWYIEMYIGLFLLMPFLNSSYHGLKTRKQKQVLLATMIVLTALPSVLNVYNLMETGWWSDPTSSYDYHKLIPSFWTILYPVMYYFLGCYFSEYKCAVKNRYLVLVLAVNTLVSGGYNIYRSTGHHFQWGAWQDWGSVFHLITAAVLFRLLSKINTKNWSVKWKQALKYCSGLCLGAYLVSYIFDKIYYEKLNVVAPYVVDKLKYFIPVVLTMLVSSLVLSAAVSLLADLIIRIAKLACESIKRSGEEQVSR